METKQHARNLAVNYANEMPSIAPSERAEVIDAYQSGYLKAIEETNVAELLEALVGMLDSFGYYDLELTDEEGMLAISKAQQAIKKATL